MTFDINKFILNSDYMCYGLYDKYDTSVYLTGTINAGQTLIFYSSSIAVNVDNLEIRGTWQNPNQSPWTPQNANWYTGGNGITYITQQGGQQPIGIYAIPFLDYTNGIARAAMCLYNNGATIAIPNTTINFKLSLYSVPE